MTISVTNIGTAGSSGSGTTISVTVPAGGVPANALIAVVNGESGSTAGGSIADTAGNTYTPLTAVFNNGSTSGGWGRLFYAYNAIALVSGNSITYTKVASGNGAAISCCYATGIQVAPDPLDTTVTNTATGSGSIPSVVSNAPSVTGELFLAFSTWNILSRTFTQDTAHGWAAPPNAVSGSNGGFQSANGGGTQVNAGSGALTFSPTLSGNASWAAFVYGFKPLTGNSKSFSVSSAESVSVFKGNYGTLISFASAQKLAMLHAITKVFTVLSGQVVGLRKAIAHKITAITSAQRAAVGAAFAKLISMSMGETAAIVVRLAKPFAIALTNAQSIAMVRFIGKVIAVLSAQSVSVRKAISTAVLTITSAQTVALRKGIAKLLAVVQAQAIAMVRAGSKIISVVSAQTVAARKSVSNHIASVSAQVVQAVPRLAKNVQMAMSMGQSALLTTLPIVFAAPKQMLKNVIRRLFILR